MEHSLEGLRGKDKHTSVQQPIMRRTRSCSFPSAGTGHPTITSPEQGLQVLQRFRTQFRPPAPHEGHTRILRLTPSDCPDSGYSEAEVREVMRRLRESPEVVPVAHTRFQQGGYNRGPSQQRGFRQQGFEQRGRGIYPRGAPPSHRGGPYDRGGRRGGATYQTTLPWARRDGESSGTSAGSGYMHASDARRSGYQAGDGSRNYDRTQESWRRS